MPYSKIKLILWTRRILCFLTGIIVPIFVFFKYINPVLVNNWKYWVFSTSLFMMTYLGMYLIVSYFLSKILMIDEIIEDEYVQLTSKIEISDINYKKIASFTMSSKYNIIEIMIEVGNGKIGEKYNEITFENLRLKPDQFYTMHFFKRQYRIDNEKMTYSTIPISINVWDLNPNDDKFFKFKIKPNKKFRPALHVVS